MKKHILITGANKGIGFEAARQLAALGYRVTLTARNEQKGKDSQKILVGMGLEVDLILLDVTDRSQLEAAQRKLLALTSRLDVLVNNAAIALENDRSILQVDPSTLHDTMQTNAFSILSMVAAMEPLIPPGGRIINVSSGTGSMTDPVTGWSPIYSVSKSLVNAITRQQAFALSRKDIDVVAMCPGWVRTDMGGASAPRHVAEGADTIVWLATTQRIETGKFYRDRTVIPW